jgi:anti-sigma B factor antagonist
MHKLAITERQTGEVTVLDLSGDILFGDGSAALRDSIRKALGAGNKNILLNFSNTRLIDSSGIGELVSGLIAINRENGHLKLLHLPERIRELLTITNLLTVFETFENEKEALGSYK